MPRVSNLPPPQILGFIPLTAGMVTASLDDRFWTGMPSASVHRSPLLLTDPDFSRLLSQPGESYADIDDALRQYLDLTVKRRGW